MATTMDDFPPSVIIPPLALKHEMTVILLHGRGSTAAEFRDDFLSTLPTSGTNLPELFQSIRWVFPCAKTRYSTVFREDLSEWYDVYSLSDPDDRNDLAVDGLLESIAHVRAIIEDERKLLLEEHGESANGSRRIILGGISMGCAVSVHVLLSSIVSGTSGNLAGFFGWCGWMPFATAIKEETEKGTDLGLPLRNFYERGLPIFEEGKPQPEAQSLSSVPVFLSHCADDSVVPARLGVEMSATLSQLGVQVDWKGYVVGDHWIRSPEEIDRMVASLDEALDVLEASNS